MLIFVETFFRVVPNSPRASHITVRGSLYVELNELYASFFLIGIKPKKDTKIISKTR